MRRDLTRGCAACRLRFSERLTTCPVCRAAALTVQEATKSVQPTSRVAWLAKWIIVLSFIPTIGMLFWMGFNLWQEFWPPKNAQDIIMFVLGGMGMCLGASITIAVPLAIWFGIIRIIRFVFERIVDRPRRALRVSIEQIPRPESPRATHPVYRAWEKVASFLEAQRDAPMRLILLVVFTYFGAQILAEIFGARPTVKTSSWREFGDGMLVLGVINVTSAFVLPLFLGVFGALANAAKNVLSNPPNLFGYDPRPPPLKNEEIWATYLKNRDEVVGRAAPLDDAERAALEIQAATQLVEPLSGQTCFAFRLVGDADGQPVDDADATSFAVVTEDGKRCVVTNADVLVSLAADTKVRADGAQGFLRQRGLPENDLAVCEGLMREGDLVRVVGRPTDIRIGTAGYRGDERRMMLDAGDGLPVVIMTANEAAS